MLGRVLNPSRWPYNTTGLKLINTVLTIQKTFFHTNKNDRECIPYSFALPFLSIYIFFHIPVYGHFFTFCHLYFLHNREVELYTVMVTLEGEFYFVHNSLIPLYVLYIQ